MKIINVREKFVSSKQIVLRQNRCYQDSRHKKLRKKVCKFQVIFLGLILIAFQSIDSLVSSNLENAAIFVIYYGEKTFDGSLESIIEHIHGSGFNVKEHSLFHQTFVVAFHEYISLTLSS